MQALSLLQNLFHAFFLNQSDVYKITTALAKLEMNIGSDIFEAWCFNFFLAKVAFPQRKPIF